MMLRIYIKIVILSFITYNFFYCIMIIIIFNNIIIILIN